MAYYFTPDGRVHTVDVEVKDDGSVRPRNYSEFASNESNPEKNNVNNEYRYIPHVEPKIIKKTATKKRTKKETAEIRSKIEKILNNTTLSIEAIAFIRSTTCGLTPITLSNKLNNRIVLHGLVKEYDKIIKTIKIINGNVFGINSSSDQEITIKPEDHYPLTRKQMHKEYLEKVNILLNESSLSEKAKHFVQVRTTSMFEVIITSKTRKKMKESGVDLESKIIAIVFEKINNLILEYRRKYHSYFIPSIIDKEKNSSKIASKPSDITPKPSVSKEPTEPKEINKKTAPSVVRQSQHTTTIKSSQSAVFSKPSDVTTVKHVHYDDGTFRPLKGNEWVSGNFIRKGPAPKYGYARDRFGRVQERDSYREDRDVNPYSSNSSYDFEDDNSSMDILD